MDGVTFTTRGALNKSVLRQANERLVLNVIRQNPSITRADIARITGLSHSSLTFVLKRLTRAKLVSEEKTTSQPRFGRRPTALFVRPEARMAVGVEVRRSGARVVLADLKGAIVRDKAVAWHSNHEVYLDRVHSTICSLVEPLASEVVLGAGVGIPGTIDRTSGRVIAAENLGWLNVEVGLRLRQRLPFPFLYENSAKLSALAEMWLAEQSGKPLRDFIFVTALDGLGTGVVVNGQLLQGSTSAASEFGHVTLSMDGRPCACGGRGCWEQYCSDFALCRLYTELGGDSGKEGSELTPSDIVRRAREGQETALRTLAESARYAAVGFGNLIWALNPEAIVLGDWLAEAWDLIENAVWETLRRCVASYNLNNFRILPSQHRTDSALLGAVALVLASYFTSFRTDRREGHSHSVLMNSGALSLAGPPE